MKKRVSLLLAVSLMTLGSLTFAIAVPCACAPIIIIPPIEPVPPAPSAPSAPAVQGGFAWAADYMGAPFTWERWIKPVIHITMNGTSTSVTVENGNNTGTVAGVSKFKFTKDQYTWTSNNKVNPDILELQKLLVSEKFLGVNSQTGIYDVTTMNAVASYQKAHGIKPAPIYPYGYFGILTRTYANTH